MYKGQLLAVLRGGREIKCPRLSEGAINLLAILTTPSGFLDVFQSLLKTVEWGQATCVPLSLSW